jgi:iron complex transport system ATP-binding protein
MTAAACLEVADLAFGYPGKTIGTGVSFVLSAGEVICLLGPNGGGKTTLFKTILGLLPAQGGSVAIGGVPAAALGRAATARTLGYVPQVQTGYFPFTVFDIVLMGRAPHLGPFAAPGRRDRDIARAALATIGIGHLAESSYTRISGGERQMALIARALAQEPRILVLDEPTASLDFGNQARVLDRISALAAAGLGVIFSTHDPDQAFRLADRVAMLHGGLLARFGPPADTITPASLKLLYGVDVAVAEVAVGARRRHICLPLQADEIDPRPVAD